MSLWQWSTTAANNATAATNINWAEGQAPSTVNDSARQMMADVATWFQGGAEWLNLGDVPTYVSATSFTVPINRTSVYTVGRRIRASVTAGTVYGTITASAYASVTTVTVSMDGTSALDSGLSEVDLGILNPANSSLPTGLSPTFASVTTTGNVTVGGNITATGTVTASNVTITSDERLKGEWEDLPPDFIDRLAAVKVGTYRRVDMESSERAVGVTAQSLREVLPEAVLEGASGLLSVAYGNAALAACIELAKEVKRLRAMLEPVK